MRHFHLEFKQAHLAMMNSNSAMTRRLPSQETMARAPTFSSISPPIGMQIKVLDNTEF